MPRPKGSKTETNVIKLDSRMRAEALMNQLSDLKKELKARKKELMILERAKFEAEKMDEEKKAEEEEARVLEAIKESGLTVEEFIELLKE